MLPLIAPHLLFLTYLLSLLSLSLSRSLSLCLSACMPAGLSTTTCIFPEARDHHSPRSFLPARSLPVPFCLFHSLNPGQSCQSFVTETHSEPPQSKSGSMLESDFNWWGTGEGTHGLALNLLRHYTFHPCSSSFDFHSWIRHCWTVLYYYFLSLWLLSFAVGGREWWPWRRRRSRGVPWQSTQGLTQTDSSRRRCWRRQTQWICINGNGIEPPLSP